VAFIDGQLSAPISASRRGRIQPAPGNVWSLSTSPIQKAQAPHNRTIHARYYEPPQGPITIMSPSLVNMTGSARVHPPQCLARPLFARFRWFPTNHAIGYGFRLQSSQVQSTSDRVVIHYARVGPSPKPLCMPTACYRTLPPLPRVGPSPNSAEETSEKWRAKTPSAP